MAEYAYTTVTGKIKELLQKIRTTGRPAKFTVAHLKTLGFTSSNDTTLIGVLKFIGFIDSSNIPTSLWNEYRGAHHKTVLAKAIRTGYADLFAVYPDANARPNTDLAHVFSTSSSAGAQVINKTIATFKALVEEADFSSDSSPTETSLHSGPLHQPAAAGAPRPIPPSFQTGGARNPEVHIDIQVHISPDSSYDQIDKIFESMAKHLYGPKPAA